MELSETNQPAKIVKIGSGVYTVTAGKVLRIETSPNGEEILGKAIPTGKVWEVHISVHIIETDA